MNPSAAANFSSDPRERALISRSLAGDRSAFDALVHAHADRVYSFLVRRCGRSDAADDAFQETFVRAWLRLSTFSPERGTLAAWLLGIAGRQAIDSLRTRQPMTDRREQHGLAGGSDPASRGRRDRSIWDVADQELSAEACAALWLRYAEELTPGQIARVLGRSSVSVRVMLLRARRTLGEALARGAAHQHGRRLLAPARETIRKVPARAGAAGDSV